MISFRSLSEEDFGRLYQTLLEAFSDYIVPMQPEIDALKRLYLIEGVALDYSFGAFDDDKMVGFTVNGIGDWQGKLTAYDAGTGIIPAYRRKGISRRMFEYILPVLRERQIEQYLLEVIVENKPAFELYKNLGFQIEREFAVFKRDKIFISEDSRPQYQQNIGIKEIENPDWNSLQSFWTYHPSWQNSIDSMKRSTADTAIYKKVLVVFLDNKIIGYGIVFPKSGNVPQFVIAENHRRKGFGGVLLNALQKQAEAALKVNNVDEKARDVTAFLQANGFSLLTRQYEMLLKL
jgi:ribosomal protein S18 acetylase RimI-like enzyme